MSSSPITTWMPLNIGNHLAETMHLSAEDNGIYFLLKMHYWRNGGPIENDKNTLKNVSKVSWNKCEKILLQFFQFQNGLWLHNELSLDIDKALKKKAGDTNRTSVARSVALAAQEAKRANLQLVFPSVTDPVTDPVTALHAGTPIQGCLNPLTPLPVDNPGDLNEYFHLEKAMRRLLGIERFEKPDQLLICRWIEAGYDMNVYGMPLIEKTLKAFRKKNYGTNPHSLAYFDTVLQVEEKKPFRKIFKKIGGKA